MGKIRIWSDWASLAPIVAFTPQRAMPLAWMRGVRADSGNSFKKEKLS